MSYLCNKILHGGWGWGGGLSEECKKVSGNIRMTPRALRKLVLFFQRDCAKISLATKISNVILISIVTMEHAQMERILFSLFWKNFESLNLLIIPFAYRVYQGYRLNLYDKRKMIIFGSFGSLLYSFDVSSIFG